MRIDLTMSSLRNVRAGFVTHEELCTRRNGLIHVAR